LPQGPSLRSGFRQRTPASLTRAVRLKFRVQPPPPDSNDSKQCVYWIKAVRASASSVATSLPLCRFCGFCIANHELFQLCHRDASVIGCAFDVVRVRRRDVRMAKYRLNRFLRHSQAIQVGSQASACSMPDNYRDIGITAGGQNALSPVNNIYSGRSNGR
jgi:hypothetical protein